jgi:hypothetical protein
VTPADQVNLFQHQWAAALRVMGTAQDAPPHERPAAFSTDDGRQTQLVFPRLDLYELWSSLWVASATSAEGQGIAPVPVHLVQQAAAMQRAAHAQQRNLLAALLTSAVALQSAQQRGQ